MLGRSAVLLAGGGLFAWMVSSDGWGAIVKDGSATSALGVVVGILVAALLLVTLALLVAAIHRRD